MKTGKRGGRRGHWTGLDAWRATLGIWVWLELCACGSSTPELEIRVVAPVSVPSPPAPVWVVRTPRVPGSLCAVGAVDPTFFRQDGMVRAGEAARNELARTVQVKINSVMLDVQSTRGGYVDEEFTQEVIGSISDVVLSGAQVLEIWYDDRGSISRRGMTYALACMPTDQSIAALAEKLKSGAGSGTENADRIQAVRDRARDAFAELESQELKRTAVVTSGAKPAGAAEASPAAASKAPGSE